MCLFYFIVFLYEFSYYQPIRLRYSVATFPYKGKGIPLSYQERG